MDRNFFGQTPCDVGDDDADNGGGQFQPLRYFQQLNSCKADLDKIGSVKNGTQGFTVDEYPIPI